MSTEAEKASARRWYRCNAAAVILQTKARKAGVRVTLAECRRIIAAKVEKPEGKA